MKALAGQCRRRSTALPALKPNQPTQSMRRPDGRVGQVVRRHGGLAVAQPLADQQRADQRRNAGTDMHHRAAGEIQGPAGKIGIFARRNDKKSAAPDPVASGQ